MPNDTNPPDLIADAFAALSRALAVEALARSDAGDEAAYERAAAYRMAVRAMAGRWSEGEASPVRRQPRASAASAERGA